MTPAAAAVRAELAQLDTLNRSRPLSDEEVQRVEYLLRRETLHQRAAARRDRDARRIRASLTMRKEVP